MARREILSVKINYVVLKFKILFKFKNDEFLVKKKNKKKKNEGFVVNPLAELNSSKKKSVTQLN